MEEKIIKKRKMSKTEICCYILAAVLLVVAVFMFVTSVQYILSYLTGYGMSFADMWSDSLQYIISGFMPYLVYALLLFCAGRILGIVQQDNCKAAEAVGETEKVEETEVEAILEEEAQMEEEQEASEDGEESGEAKEEL